MVIEVRWGSATHPGRVRDHNEDAVLAGPEVFAVADGMGGHAAGEVASAIAVAGLASVAGLAEVGDPGGRLVAALERANAEMRRRARADAEVAGMGATVAGIARISGRRLLVFNLGDSRVYRFRAGMLVQLTDDHSVVGELVRAGAITTEEARTHPQRHVVTRALGVDEGINPLVTTVEVAVGDCFLVASDGLFGEVPDAQIGDLLATPGTLEARARSLLDAALFRGGRDNVSVVVVAVAGVDAGADGLEDDTSPSVAGRRSAGPGPVVCEVPTSSLGAPVADDARSLAPLVPPP